MANNIADSASLAFLGPTIVATFTPGYTIHVDATAVLGTNVVGGAAMTRFSTCHQPTGGGALTDHFNDGSPVSITTGTKIPVAATQRIAGMVAGTYNIGLCYQMAAGDGVDWNNNGFVNLKVIVTQG